MRALLAGLVVAVGVATATGCGFLEPEDAFFTVAVDSVTGPDTIVANSAYVQRLWGPLSSNSCASVDRLFIRPGSVTEIQVQGRRRLGPCETGPSIYLKGYEVSLTAPSATGEHRIRVLRPGTPLVRTIVIR